MTLAFRNNIVIAYIKLWKKSIILFSEDVQTWNDSNGLKSPAYVPEKVLSDWGSANSDCSI